MRARGKGPLRVTDIGLNSESCGGLDGLEFLFSRSVEHLPMRGGGETLDQGRVP